MRKLPIGLALLSAAGVSFAAHGVAAPSPTVATPAASGSGQDVVIDAAKTPPPGLVKVKGGNGKIGSTKKQIEELLQTESYQGLNRTLDGETPQHRVTLPDYYMGKFEVTNEQYLQFVNATGHQPPSHWGESAIQEAQAAFGKAEAEKVKAAKDAGGTYKRQRWNDDMKKDWWASNWQDAAWAIPEGLEGVPVVFINYRDARAYCRWAGLRLPTEFEWEFVARGGKDQWFPWGDDWEAEGRAHTTELRRQKLFPVGSFPNGASPSGAMDLAGSVWEWTSSPYDAYPRFKANKYKVQKTGGKKETLEPTARWDSNEVVVKGGAFQFGLIAARATTRRATARSQSTDGLGFRVASSQLPGRDAAEAIWLDVIRNSGARTAGELFDVEGTVGVDRWQEAEVKGNRAEDYRVISGYDHIMFVPRSELAEAPGGQLNRASRVAPTLFGYLATTVPMVEPALEPGVYLVGYREKGTILTSAEAKGGDAEGEDSAAADEEITDDTPEELLTPLQRLLRKIDTKENILVFMDAATGEYVASVKTRKAVDQKDKKPGKNSPLPFAVEERKVVVGTGANKAFETQDWITINSKVRRTAKSRIIPLEFELRVQPGALGTGWRR